MDEQSIVPIVYKVLSDPLKYATQFRFFGILHEAYCTRNGHAVPPGNVGQYGEGYITTNSITGELGLIVNPADVHYCVLPEPHLSRLVDVVDGDGWIPAEEDPEE